MRADFSRSTLIRLYEVTSPWLSALCCAVNTADLRSKRETAGGGGGPKRLWWPGRPDRSQTHLHWLSILFGSRGRVSPPHLSALELFTEEDRRKKITSEGIMASDSGRPWNTFVGERSESMLSERAPGMCEGQPTAGRSPQPLCGQRDRQDGGFTVNDVEVHSVTHRLL